MLSNKGGKQQSLHKEANQRTTKQVCTNTGNELDNKERTGELQ